MDNNIFSIEKVVMVDDSFINENTILEDIPEDIEFPLFKDRLEEFLDDDEDNRSKTLANFFDEEGISKDDKDFFFSYLNKDYKPIEEFFQGVSIEKVHPVEFDSKITLFEKLNEPILFILDKILSNQNYETTLRNILEKIEPLFKKNKCFLFLYSSEVVKFDDYNQVQEFLSEKLALSNNSIRTLSMHINFVEKNKELGESMISTAIRKSQKANYLYSFYSLQEEAMKTMNKKIWDINNNELLVHYNYLSEGQHIDEILFDIYNSKFLRQYENHRVENYDSLVKPMRESIHSYISKYEDMKYYSVKSRIIKELNNEFQRSKKITSLNESDDISYGDIIEIDQTFFLVLSQQCDITIRSDGSRVSNEIFLLEIEKVETILNAKSIDEKINNILKVSELKRNDIQSLFDEPEFVNLLSNEEILKELKEKYSRNNYKILDTSDRNRYEYFRYKKNAGAYYIDSFILDCLLIPKEDGYINVVKKNIESCKSIRHSTKLHLLEKFTYFIEEFDNLTKKIQDEDIIGKFIFPKLKVQIIKSEDDKVMGARYKNISRIGRLDSTSANEIHQEYSRHLLRVAKNEAPIL